MEQKKKGTLGKVVGILVSLMLMAALAVGFVSQYPRITEDAKEIYDAGVKDGNYWAAREYFEQVCGLLPGIHVEYMQQVKGDTRSAGEILLDNLDENVLEDYISGNREEDTVWTDYKEEFEDWYQRIRAAYDTYYEKEYPQLKEALGVQLHVQNHSDGTVYGALQPEKAMEDEALPFVVRIYFDENGYPNVLEDKMQLDCEWMVYSHVVDQWEDDTSYRCGHMTPYMQAGVPLLAGMTLTIANTGDAFLDDAHLMDYGFRSGTRWEAFQAMQTNYVIFVLAALAIVLVAALLLSLIKPLGLRETRMANIPLEILIGIVLILAWLILDVMGGMILVTQMSVDYPHGYLEWPGILEDLMAGQREGQILLMVNGAVWFAFFSTAYFSFISVLQIFYKGLFGFLKKNTLIGRMICFLYRKSKELMEYAAGFDFKDKGTRKICILVGVNFVLSYCVYFLAVMAAYTMTWYLDEEVLITAVVIGFFAFLGYSGLLFLYLQKKWNTIRLQYTELLDTTEEMASGDTKVTYNGKPGIFRELQEKLMRVQGGFDAAVQEEVKSQRMKSELITNVSHDLKTPLTAIITYVDLLKNETISAEERQEYVKVLEQKSARLKTLIEDLFEVSKATSGDITLNPQELDLGQLIQEVQLNLEDRIMQSGIQFKLTVPQEKVLVCLDGQKTCRIFENLFVNITKYGLCGSRAFIDMELAEDKVRVTVKNVSANEITYASDEIMERFTRGDASRNTEGSGLGLAIVKSFVEAQGGTVEIQFDGDLFKVIVEFPCVKVQKQEPEENVETAVEVPVEVEAETQEEPEQEEVAEEIFVEVTENTGSEE